VDKALALDAHNVAIRWEAALLALRLDDRDQALDHLRYILAVDPVQRDAAFQLGRALLGPDENPQTLLPSEPEGLTGILIAALDPFVAAKGRRSLRLTFNSFPTLDFAGVTQLVAVEPGREYHLEARAKASGFETRSGVKLEIVLPRDQVTLAETNTIAGTTDWMALTAMVRIPDDTSLVVLRVRRARTAGPEGNLGG